MQCGPCAVEINEETILGIDPGVRKLVRWLNANGFRTNDSGDGRSKFESAEDIEAARVSEGADAPAALPCPNVTMTVRPENLTSEAIRLYNLLASVGIDVPQRGWDPETPDILVEFQPAMPDDAWITLLNVDDAMLPEDL